MFYQTLFNLLHESKCPIILTCTKIPTNIKIHLDIIKLIQIFPLNSHSAHINKYSIPKFPFNKMSIMLYCLCLLQQNHIFERIQELFTQTKQIEQELDELVKKKFNLEERILDEREMELNKAYEERVRTLRKNRKKDKKSISEVDKEIEEDKEEQGKEGDLWNTSEDVHVQEMGEQISQLKETLNQKAQYNFTNLESLFPKQFTNMFTQHTQQQSVNNIIAVLDILLTHSNFDFERALNNLQFFLQVNYFYFIQCYLDLFF